jgi:hypothetical protein
MKITLKKVVLTSLIFLVFFVGYTSAQNANEPKKAEKKAQDKSKYFCDGLSLPQERQCPTMDDLDNGVVLRLAH